jgi:predicted TIM-barrel fold metal-dependent hydrolase
MDDHAVVLQLFDSHLHIIDPRFPLVPNHGYLPDAFTVADYRARIDALRLGREAVPTQTPATEHNLVGDQDATRVHVVGGAVVSGSFQAFDQSYLLDALQSLGPSFVGVIQLPVDTSDAELRRLDRAGVRAVRFNLRRGGSAELQDLDQLARRAHAVVGWHAEIYVHGDDLAELYPLLAPLPAVVIDHVGLTRTGVPTLLRLAERGAYVKATGFGRLDFAPGPVLRDVARANPRALLFGTDLPSTRAPRPFQADDVALLVDALATLGAQVTANALLENAVALYRPMGAVAP